MKSTDSGYQLVQVDKASGLDGLETDLKRFGDYSVFHDRRFYNLFNELESFSASSILVRRKNSVLGFVTFVTVSEFSGLLKYFTSRCIMFAPPLYTDDEVLKILLDEVKSEVPSAALYLKLKGTNSLSARKSLLENQGFKWIPHLNFILDLSDGSEGVWSRISKTRKKQIRRAERRGLTVDMVNSGSFDEHYVLLKKTYDKAGLPLYPIELIQKAIDSFSPTNQILMVEVRLEGQLVAFRLILLYQTKMYDWFAGSSVEHHSYYPNDIAVWKALEWGVNNGYTEFDFGGAGHPDKPYGIREFKRKFGGKEVNYGVFMKVNAPVRNWMLEKYRSLRR